METVVERLVVLDDMEQARNVFGMADRHLLMVENQLNVKVHARNGEMRVTGFESSAELAADVLNRLVDIARQGETVTEQQVRYFIALGSDPDGQRTGESPSDLVCVTYRGKPIKCKTFGQKHYVEEIRRNAIVFGIGPAGTGKTFLAVAMAVKAFREKQISRIILTRPAVEAGERLGFLPGDLQSKVDPYLRPLYDALYHIMGPETYQTHLERGIIEVAPLAYMRGRTLEDAFIILDEAQNTTPEQMKMFLTRIGIGSRTIITGDVTQIDLPNPARSGLLEARRILREVEGISFVHLSARDVVRHELVQRIILAYDQDARSKERHGTGKRGEPADE